MRWNLSKLLQSLKAVLWRSATDRPAAGQAAGLPSLARYEIVAKVAEGSMGAVYKGRDRRTGETVAVKTIAPDVATNPILVKRFEREFRSASRLRHPHIVRSLDFGEERGLHFLVMEYVEGPSLGRRIETQGRLPEDEAVRVIGQVAAALLFAHRHGIIHRDVKPDNILLTADGQAKLGDFGLVKQTADEFEDLTQPGRGLGTPNFMAPEQFGNARNVDLRCDIYGLGATLYMMVTGEWPFAGKNILQTFKKKASNELTPARQLVPTLGGHIEQAIHRAMNPDPNQRQVSCAEFLEELTGQCVP
jgi:serine/threonine protein kinase